MEEVSSSKALDRCSVAFLLSDDYQSTFSKFKFPMPVDSNVLRDQQTPTNDDDPQAVVNFMRDVFDFESFSPYHNWLDPHTVYSTTDMEQDFGVYDIMDDLRSLADVIESLPEFQSLEVFQNQKLSQDLLYVLTPIRVIRSIAQYFEFWHPTCRIIHRPSFKANGVSKPLLLGMILLGTLYDPDELERKRVSAIAEYLVAYIFSHYPPMESNAQGTVSSKDALHLVQSGFLVVVAQFWTGDPVSQRKAASERFNSVVKVRTHVHAY